MENGKKISIDSSTLVNKVFEVIEAKNIFNFEYKNIKILIHPKSYLHAIIKFKNGIIKFLAHDTSMKIPIFNSIYHNTNKKLKTEKINLDILNNLNLAKVDKKKFPSINILKLLPKNISLYETVLVSANDELVKLFLENKINYRSIIINLFKILKQKRFIKYKTIKPKNANEILELAKFVRLKIRSLSV